MNCFGESPNKIHLGGLSNVFISEGCPQLKKIFLFEDNFHTWQSMCKGVGEDSRHRIGHVDIQVGSCICLNVFGCHYMCT